MVDAYSVRNARELSDLASATALAMHDPKGIKRHIKAPRRRARGDHPFVQEQWWKTA